MPTIEWARGRRRQRGFSYLWVLMLVALMGVGLTVAADLDAIASRREREAQLLVVGRQFQVALGRYHAGGADGARHEYPATLEDLLRDPRVPGVRRHLRKVFVDPITGNKQWGLVRLNGRIVGVHSLSEQEPIKQDGFTPEHRALKGKKKYAEWLFVYPPELLITQPDGAPMPETGTDGQPEAPPITAKEEST
jgi:hypothetical protein